MLKQLLEPKGEVLTGKLQGVIDLERVADSKRRALESRPRDFLQSTFASGEIRRLVESINKRLNSADAETGLFLAEGPKGVGKSHGLLIPLHLTGSLPSFLRGSLTGLAKFSGELALEFAGIFTKPQVEEMVERLPDFSPGSCRVTIGVQPNSL